MRFGISLAWSFVPTEMKGLKPLRRRVHHRDGKREYWFFSDDLPPKIPVRRNGRLEFARWGNGRGQSRSLPRAGWTWLSTIKSGYWKTIETEAVEIPATFIYDRGVWLHVSEGIKGLLVPDEHGNAVAYIICEPASHYYKIMTRSDRMPVFIGERI